MTKILASACALVIADDELPADLLEQIHFRVRHRSRS